MSHKLVLYENLRDMLEGHLAKLESEKTLTREILQEIHQTTSSLEYIDDKIEECKEKKWFEEHPEEMGASGRIYDRASYGSGRMMPRHSGEGNRTVNSYPSHDWMSRDNAKRNMVRKLSTLMDDTMSEEDRAAISDCIDRINKS